MRPISTSDSLKVQVTVLQDDGTPLDLTGKTLEIVAHSGQTTVSATVTAPTPTSGVMIGIFAPGALAYGAWTIQGHVDDGTESKMVAQGTQTVVRSHKVGTP